MSFEYGKNIRLQIFGQSHSAMLGCVLDGLPAGEAIDLAAIQRLLARRAPGGAAFATARQESDEAQVVCGLLDGKTTGTPLCALFANRDCRSGDYDELRRLPRPGHSDWPAFVKFAGQNDVRGGGAFSGRMTAPLCFAGGAAEQLLARRGIDVFVHLASVGGIEDEKPDFCAPDTAALCAVKEKAFPVLDDAAGERMQQAIANAKAGADSVGGSVRCLVTGLPVGLGSHMFDGVENRLAAAVFGIPGVKGLEFGSGFAGCEGRGSQQNDSYALRGARVTALKNDAGGVLGGMTSGMPLVFRVGFKPTPSIGREQQTVDLTAGADAPLTVRGRHDPCIVPRAAAAVEAAAALTVLDLLLDSPAVLTAPANAAHPF